MDTPFFRECMSYKHFSDLKRFLHFSNNETFDTDVHPNPKLNKIYHVFDYLTTKFKSMYTMERDVTIDESLMLYESRLSWIQYIPLKRVRFGIKFYLLCESKSGYVCDMIIYTGKGTKMNKKYEHLPNSSQIVMTLLEPLLGKGYCLTTDNFYTSPQLAELLLNHKTRKLQKGQVSAYKRGKVLAMKWKDKRDVCLLSTIHSAKTCTVERRRKSVTIPELVRDYNLTMRKVDSVDQSLCNYSLLRKIGKRYFEKLFSHLLELTIWNAFIVYNITGHKKKSLDLIEESIEKYKKTSIKSKGRPSSEDTPLRLSARHFPDIVPDTEKKKNAARLCVVCSRRKNESGKKIRKESRYFCKEYDVGLCAVPCYKIYHTKYNYTS